MKFGEYGLVLKKKFGDNLVITLTSTSAPTTRNFEPQTQKSVVLTKVKIIKQHNNYRDMIHKQITRDY